MQKTKNEYPYFTFNYRSHTWLVVEHGAALVLRYYYLAEECYAGEFISLEGVMSYIDDNLGNICGEYISNAEQEITKNEKRSY